MDIDQVKALAAQGESNTLEFKKTTAQLRPAFETICAFLNGKGGVVLMGVNDDGKIIGQDVTDNTRQEIAREIKKIEPPVHIEVHYIHFKDSKYVIAIEALFGRHMPYVYDGRGYERNQSTTGKMSQHKYEQLLVKRGQLNHSWEEEQAHGYSIDSLDRQEIMRTVKEGVDKNRISVEVLNYDIERILSNLKLLRNGHLINAAIVLYAKDVLPHYSNCMIRMARFRGTDKLGDFIDNQRVHGNAFQLISAASDFTQRHLPIASFFETDKMQRIDQPAVPALALREALVNSISHRDYSNRSSTISLAIFDDRLEIWNNGELPPELKIEDLRHQHESYPRNEEIATIFYKRGWVEGWGTGTVRMIGYCKQNGTPEPEFKEYSGGFAVIFRFKEPMGSIQKNLISEKPALNVRQENILQILHSGETRSANDIHVQIQGSSSLRTVKADLAILKKYDLIEQIGKGPSALWKIKH